MKSELIAEGVSLILAGLEVDPEDRNFQDTPSRVARFYKEMFGEKENHFTTFPEKHNQMVVLRDHVAFSLCPHHLLPVKFTISVAYIPHKEVLGVSKLARLFDHVNTHPLMQETLTDYLADTLYDLTGGLGAAVVVKGEHACMMIRGIRSRGSIVSSALRGVLSTNPQARQEFLQLVV